MDFNFIIPFNHIVYQLVIILLLYITIKKTQNLNITQRYRWSFITLFSMFALAIDWYIWHDIPKSLLFATVLIAYIYYNKQNEATISKFLDIIDTAKDETNALSAAYQEEQYKIMIDTANKVRITNEIENLIYNPPDMNPRQLERVQFVDAAKHPINPIDGTFEPFTPAMSYLPENYTTTMLNALYESPQYRNILKNDIDKYLDNDIHIPPPIPEEKRWENYALLRNPKRQFYDSNWEHVKTPYYNDHCYSNGEENEFVKFGYKLENCTNKQNVLLDATMQQISTNTFTPSLKDFRQTEM